MTVPGSYYVSMDRWRDILAGILDRQPVMGPVERPDQPGFFMFDWLKRAEDFRFDYTATTIPPKKAFFPPEERLFRFNLEEDPPELEMIRGEGPFTLVGVHPCDLAAIDALDRAYADPPAEVRWAYNRKRSTVVGLDCLPDEYCFCQSTGDVDARGSSDLFLTPVEDGFVMEARTEAGRELIEPRDLEAASAERLDRAESFRREKHESFTARINAEPARIAEVLAGRDLTEVWRETADRCYSCGSCNTTCPTCFCFLMSDDLDLSLKHGHRQRSWDSCQLLDFALVAGGHNFRGQRWERVRHRWHRKFLYLYNEFGRPYCTGCGRCGRACTADINLAAVTNLLLVEAKKKEKAS
jgi:sulfhydrogenase subunit beta (sulfur reductase)